MKLSREMIRHRSRAVSLMRSKGLERGATHLLQQQHIMQRFASTCRHCATSSSSSSSSKVLTSSSSALSSSPQPPFATFFEQPSSSIISNLPDASDPPVLTPPPGDILDPAHWPTQDVPPEAWLQPHTEVTTLRNGIRIASQGTSDESSTVGVWIDAGSRYESAETNGAAHFLEHMIFKGTTKRSRVQLEREVEDIGGHLNAYTSREQTVYYAKVMNKDVPQALDILADILLNSKLDARSIEEERGVILRESEEVNKSMEEVVFDYLHKSAFRDCPLSYPILGPEENIKSLKKEDLKDYIRRNYKADRIVVAAAGGIQHADLVKMVEKLFGNLPTTPEDLVLPVAEKPYFVGAQLMNRNDDMGPNAHVAVAWEGVPWKSPDAIAFMIMQSIIGGYNKADDISGQGGVVPAKVSGNSTVFRIANKQFGQSCANAFSAFNTHYKDTGLFGFYVEADEVALDHAMSELIWGNIQMAYSITAEEVHRAKQSLLTQLLGSLDSTTNIAEEIGRHLLVYGRRIPQAEFIERILAIDEEEIKRVAWKYLHDAEINIVAMGPLFGMKDYLIYRQQTHWWRY